jgi:1-acyl-sn-glycerol-3-phosphate acyltransferase
VPEFLLRFIVWLLAVVMYRIRLVGREHIPQRGPAVIVCNHVTYVDWMFLASAVRTPVRFVMHYAFMQIKGAGFLFRGAKVIPIASAHEDQDLLEEAFARIRAELAAGEIVCIFPEGKLTLDGQMNSFKPGIERIIQETLAPVTPMALQGLWGSIKPSMG